MKRQLSVFFTLVFLGVFAFAASSPLPMLEKTANQLIVKLQQNKAKLKQDPSIINNLVTTLIIPHVAQEQMARSVVSRSNWGNASPTQRQQFVKQFRKLVVRTYSSAFSNYTNESVKFRPLRRGQLKQKYIKVNSIVLRPGRPSIPITYALAKKKGHWLITDFSVEGVSMVSSFKSQFASLDSSKGLPGLTAILKKHNKTK